MKIKKILQEQIEYYRARAQEYDRSISGAVLVFEPAIHMLLQLGTFKQVLELACGTGFWTKHLLQISEHVTAADAAPEMLQIAREHAGDERITYQQLDLFQWQPAKTFDLVFFANWLSHVPPEALDDFLNKVRASLKAGGYIALVDQHAPSEADSAIAQENIYAVRPLEDGREFTIVKAFYDLNELKEKLTKLGFTVTSQKFSETFFFLSGVLK
jgi:demethylmenaquinone methyltransferase/2-methoxy-6-polyprenyl-1,4-benzoquinol methylase